MSVILEATRQGTQPVAFINVVSSHLFREEKEIRDKVRAFVDQEAIHAAVEHGSVPKGPKRRLGRGPRCIL